MKSQVSIEFLVYFSLLVLIGLFFAFNYLSRGEELSNLKMESEASNLLQSLKFEIDSAVISGDGYERRFYVPESISGYTNFSIQIANYTLFLDWEGHSKSEDILVGEINGTILKGWNNIRNSKGVIYVN